MVRSGWMAGTIALLLCIGSPSGCSQAPASAVRAFEQYTAKVDGRLAQQHRSADRFIASAGSKSAAQLRQGELIIERLSPSGDADPPGALLHHWRGTAFVAGATVDDFERLMKNVGTYPQYFSPQVVRAQILTPYSGAIPDRFSVSMRLRQKHVITAVMDTTYDVAFDRVDARHAYSISRSTRIDEIAAPGTSRERVLAAAEEHGFLWRLNTYWSCEERDQGLYMQIESISLTRAIPTGLVWALRPYMDSVPRDSLQFTLGATIKALKQIRPDQGR